MRIPPSTPSILCTAAWMLAISQNAMSQTCGVPIPLRPDTTYVGGTTCGSGEQNILLCRELGESGPAVVYRIDAQHLKGQIEASANLSLILVVKNSDCGKGDCISIAPGSPLLFTPDMQGPFSIVIAADPRLEPAGTCGSYSLLPKLQVISDLIGADGFDRAVLPP